VEHGIISSTEESAAGDVQCQDHVDGLVHHEYIPRGQVVNKEFYKTVLQRCAQTSPLEVVLWQLDPAQ